MAGLLDVTHQLLLEAAVPKETSQATAISSSLSGALYEDMKSWAVSAATKLVRVYKKATVRSFSSPAELLHAAAAGDLERGQEVRVDCKIAPAGPFLSSHYLMPFVGSHTSMRLGPPLQAPNPIMGMMAQATSHLIPVGLYPPIAAGVEQVTLYPPDAAACGFVSILPGVNDLVQVGHLWREAQLALNA